MIVRLTYYGSNRSTLVNLKKVESIYQVYDRINRRFSTKICFNGNNSFINVEEDLQTIMQLQQDFIDGKYQPTDFESNTVDDRMEELYYQNRPAPPRFREKNFNSQNTYNENHF